MLPWDTFATVYPRVCGATIGGDKAAVANVGLSPRVRGNHGRSWASVFRRGSIPACAGQPPGQARPFFGQRVYPRVCGATRALRSVLLRLRGLSPRVRGNRVARGAVHRRPGSIPACAGQPAHAQPAAHAGGVYPRVCGGTPRQGGRFPTGWGLSPRVRGNLRRQFPVARRIGSIPACAGEPVSSRSSGAQGTVYPRVCGGTLTDITRGGRSMGLSPRVRGNRCWARCRPSLTRSIPACAGEPR